MRKSTALMVLCALGIAAQTWNGSALAADEPSSVGASEPMSATPKKEAKKAEKKAEKKASAHHYGASGVSPSDPSKPAGTRGVTPT